MFDGNHRSRKTINLSQSTRRQRTAHQTDSRSSILERSKQEREKRLLQQKRLNACKRIQRLWRGHACRIHLLRQWMWDLQDQQQQEQVSHSKEGLSMNQRFERLAGLLQPGLKRLFVSSNGPVQPSTIAKCPKAVTGDALADHTTVTSRYHRRRILVEYLSEWIRPYRNQEYRHDDPEQNDPVGKEMKKLKSSCRTHTFLFSEYGDNRFVLYHRLLLYCFENLSVVMDPHDCGDWKLFMDVILCIFQNVSVHTVISILNHGRSTGEQHGYWLSLTELNVLNCLKAWMWRSTRRQDIAKEDEDAMVMKLLHVCDVILDALHNHANVTRDVKITSVLKGYMAVIVLGVEMDVSRPICMQLQQQFQSQSQSQSQLMQGVSGPCQGNRYAWKWYFALVQQFVPFIVENGWRWKEDLPFLPKTEDMLPSTSGRELIYIQNMLDILSMAKRFGTEEEERLVKLWFIRFIGFLFHPCRTVMLQRNGALSHELHSLIVLSSLAAKGVDIMCVIRGKMVIEMETKLDEDEDEDEADKEDDEDMESKVLPNRTTADITSERITSSISSKYKLRRQDLQTIHKLDSLYKFNVAKSQGEIIGWIQEQSVDFVTKLCRVAISLGNGDILTQLIPVIFDPTNHDNADFGALDERGMFCVTLCLLLQNCSSAQARDAAMSPLLSRLAFRRVFLEDLWQYTQQQFLIVRGRENDDDRNSFNLSVDMVTMYSAINSFCDLFSHHLLAIDDDDFLETFTVSPNCEKAKGGILATDVIDLLKSLLYEMYWSKPVVAADFILPWSQTASFDQTKVEAFNRARLLLSGTKVWNSIYVRWSRLYRSISFCDEECWWFPHLVTRYDDENGAVDSQTASMNQEMEGDDNRSVDSRMEIDENVTLEGRDENDGLAASFKDPKMARILTSIPQVLPFERRARLFSSLLNADIAKMQDESDAMREMMWNMQQGIEGAEYRGREKVKIRRDELYNDSMSQLSILGRRLKKKVQVTFINKHGNEEAGVDGGGLFKEFLDDLIKDAFHPQTTHERVPGPLFIESPLQTLAINTALKPSPLTLAHYRFLGRVLGKAVYESILVEPQFCLPFLNQLLGQHNTVDDLKNIDPVYHKHLNSLRKMKGSDISSLGLTFEITILSDDGKSSKVIELIPGGSSVHVTDENVIRYIHLVAHRRLNVETAAQTNEFLSGFRDLIPASWVKLFSPYELQKVISGDNSVQGFDVCGLKSVMLYGGGYHPSQPIIQWFWEIIEDMTPVQKSKFLKFMTSCSRQPLLGFGHLSPLPCIHQVRIHEDEEQRLPTSATCMHLLKLPNYRSKNVLKEKLLYAIESGAGFELS